MRIALRAAFGWGPTAARPATPTKGLVIHYDGGNLGLAGKPHTACIDYWLRTRVFHMEDPKHKWLDIGYSYGACPHGEVFEGRGLGREQAAQPGGNRDWYSCTLMSGPTERPTDVQVDAVRQLRAWLMGQGVAAGVKGHRDFVSTDCPGDLLYGLVKDGTFTRVKEDDVSADQTYRSVWETDAMPVPYGTPTNPQWKPRSVLVDHGVRLRSIEAKLDELIAALKSHEPGGNTPAT